MRIVAVMLFLAGAVVACFAGDCTVQLRGDVNGDCRVDLYDMSIFAEEWLVCSEFGNPDCDPTGAKVYYAAPGAVDDGRDRDHPMKISDFWEVAKPGDTLVLLEGEYTGDDYMIEPTGLVRGLPQKPITIRAENDGAATINGENVRRPVHLFRNSYVNLIGFNAKNSNEDVVKVERSTNVHINRVCGWDARDGNCFIFWASLSQYVLFEDCAGWGIARKIFANSHYGDYVTFRRCWASWDGCHNIGPKMTYSSYYDSVGCVIENCVGTWTASRMQESYYLLDDNQEDGLARLPNGELVEFSNHQVEHPISIFGLDGFAYIPVEPAGVVVRNCASYTQDTAPLSHFHGITSMPGDVYLIENCFAWPGQDNGGERYCFYLDGATAVDVECRHICDDQCAPSPPCVVLKNGATISCGRVDLSEIFPLPIHDRVKALSGHDMTLYIPTGRDNTYYASPTGGGAGKTPEEPMSVGQFSVLAQAGDTLILEDGVYLGENLLQPPQNTSGCAGRPITVRAQHDGQAIFDGAGSDIPVKMVSNRHWVIEGIGARNSSDNVVYLTNCDDITLRNVTAHDAGAGSVSGPWGVFCLWNCEDVLLENCAGWGRGDKIFMLNDACINVTLRYCFGMWQEGLHSSTSKTVFASLPQGDNIFFDRCVALWDPRADAEIVQGGFVCDLTKNCRLVCCVSRNRRNDNPALPLPRALYVLNGASGDKIYVENVLAHAETAGLSGAIMTWAEGGPFEHRGCTFSCGVGCDVVAGAVDAAACIGPWPMNDRILDECGVDVESLYTEDVNTEWYVSSDGTGQGRSESDPMSLGSWLFSAKAGDTCYLLDGGVGYQGPDNMIVPPNGASGTESKPITIRALQEGSVTIDGQEMYKPVSLTNNHYWHIEGINACNSSGHVVEINNSDNCQIRKVCAWDDSDSSTGANFILYSKNSENVLFEDCAGWGRAVQIFSFGGSSTANTLRRCWASWEGTDYHYGNKIAFAFSNQSTAYASAEDCIGRWAADTSPYYHPYGVFSVSGGVVPAACGGLRRCIAYTQQTSHLPSGLYYIIGDPASPMALGDCLAVSQPANASCRGFYLWACADGPIQADGCTVILKGTDNTVTQGQANLPAPFNFPINTRVNELTGHNVLSTLGLD